MPRARSPKRNEAYQLWLASDGKKKLKDIAAELGVSETQIRKWKNQDKWNGNVTNQMKGNVTKRKRGGQPGNKNAVGHGAPKGNQNAVKQAVLIALFGALLTYLADAFSEQAYVFGCSRYAAVAAAGSFLEMLRRAGERKGI